MKQNFGLKKSFDYDVINYLMLMMFDKQVHYHVIPRYEKETEFNHESWVDENYPGIPNPSGENVCSESASTIIKKITNYI